MRSNARYFSILTHPVMVSGEQDPEKTAGRDPEKMTEMLKAFVEKTGFRHYRRKRVPLFRLQDSYPRCRIPRPDRSTLEAGDLRI